MCSLFWFLVKLSVIAKWLARKLVWGSLIVARGSSPESSGRRVHVIFLVYCIASLFYYVLVLSPAPMWYNYIPTFMARYSLFVLKVPLNPKQANKQMTRGNLSDSNNEWCYKLYVSGVAGLPRLVWLLFVWVRCLCLLLANWTRFTGASGW